MTVRIAPRAIQYLEDQHLLGAAEPKHYVLIADGNTDFTDALAKEATPDLPKLICVRTLRDCQKRLSHRGTQFVGIFVNPMLGNPAWISVVRDAHNYHPNSPIFVVYDYTMPEEAVLKDLGVLGAIKKPATYADLLKELKYVPPASAAPAASATEAGKPADVADPGYLPMKSMRLASKQPLQFDVYIRLASGHFTKVWPAGSTVDHEQLARHAKEGVTEYFILQKDQEACLKACQSHLLRVIDDPSITLETKRSELAALGEDTIRMLQGQGIDGTSIEYALSFVESSQKLSVELMRNMGGLQHFLRCCRHGALRGDGYAGFPHAREHPDGRGAVLQADWRCPYAP